MNKPMNELSLETLGQVSGGGSFEDTMGDMSSLMQMRMQKYLDAYSKCFEMLSNAMHNVASTSGAVVQNMK